MSTSERIDGTYSTEGKTYNSHQSVEGGKNKKKQYLGQTCWHVYFNIFRQNKQKKIS